MPVVHPTAIVDDDARLDDDVEIGPHCVITGPVVIGAGTRVVGNAHLNGPLTLGTGNSIYPSTCLGFAPQSVSHDHETPGPGLVIGDGNRFREGVTIHRAMGEEDPTTIGSRNYFMAFSHAGHDCRVGNDCVFANCTLLGGHVEVGDRVVTGGNTSVHQFCRIGRGAMLSGSMATSRDIPPFFMLTGDNLVGSINLVGLRRLGMSREEIEDVRWIYATLYRRGDTLSTARRRLEERAGRPIVAEYIRFIENSTRGLCTARPDPRRGTIAASCP